MRRLASGKTLGITATRLQNAMSTQNHEDSQIGIPTKGSRAALHLGDLLTALADGITELCLRHPHLLAVGGKLLDERTDQFTLLFGLYKLRHNFPNFLFKFQPPANGRFL